LDYVALAAALQVEESSRQQQQEQALPEDVEERRREGQERWRRLRTLRSGKEMAKGATWWRLACKGTGKKDGYIREPETGPWRMQWSIRQ
jgi:hypothetical protein